MKNNYILNPTFVLNFTDDYNIIFTPNMEKIYVLGEVENIIVNAFINPISINDAISKICLNFTSSTFKEAECLEFIHKLIEEEILCVC